MSRPVFDEAFGEHALEEKPQAFICNVIWRFNVDFIAP
jgi:hypothetical protein